MPIVTDPQLSESDIAQWLKKDSVTQNLPSDSKTTQWLKGDPVTHHSEIKDQISVSEDPQQTQIDPEC